MHSLVESLNIMLCDLHLFLQKTRSARWKLEGPHIFAYRQLIDGLRKQCDEDIDYIAERICALGGTPFTRYSDFLAHSGLSELENGTETESMTGKLLGDLNIMVSNLKYIADEADDHDDRATAAILEDMVIRLERESWLTRAALGYANGKERHAEPINQEQESK